MVNAISQKHSITLSIIAETMDPVSTAHQGNEFTGPRPTTVVGQSIVPTHTFATVPELDVLIVPGGIGGFSTGQPTIDWLRATVPKLPHLITVCNGAALVASSGALDGKRATTNKAFWKECTSCGPRTHWIAKARWVQDGNVWTSSGVSAGIDATLSWIASVYGDEYAEEMADMTEFVRSKGESDDPFAAKYVCQDILPQAV
jgi:transcriptional regulator GlxA family with amidase domain